MQISSDDSFKPSHPLGGNGAVHQAQAQIPLPRPLLPRLTIDQTIWQRYIRPGLILNGVIWGLALLYLVAAPRKYTSSSAVNLPGASPITNVNLPDIGQASAENSSPYAITNQDPRENYKFIALSEPVLKSAAAKLDMPVAKFGKPRIKLQGNSTFMTFQFKGANPEEARNKAIAFYNSFEEHLNVLRIQESVQRNADLRAAVESSQAKLNQAQKQLAEFKGRSGLNSNQQVAELSSNIESLRKQRADVLSQQQLAYTRMTQLSTNLTLTPQQAGAAYALQTDQLFQQNLKDYTTASANLVVLSSRFQPAYPAVQDEQAKREAAFSALMSRSQMLLGQPVSESSLAQLNFGKDSSKEVLFQNLVTAQAEQQGLRAQAQELERQIVQLERRLNRLAAEEPTLDALKRDLQVAEAVFSSHLAKLNLGSSKNFASYPMMQVVTEPNLPEKPTSPDPTLVLLGALTGTFLTGLGIAGLWAKEHKPWANKPTRSLNPQTVAVESLD